MWLQGLFACALRDGQLVKGCRPAVQRLVTGVLHDFGPAGDDVVWYNGCLPECCVMVSPQNGATALCEGC